MVVITTETKMGKSFVDVLNALMVRTKTRRMIPERRNMNLRQKKKLFNKKVGWNPPEGMHYSDRRYHDFIGKLWGGLTELKKQETIRAVEDFNRNIQDRNIQIRASRRYTR
jgi:hypothetical protein